MTKNNPFAKYEELGEQEVRERLAAGRYGDSGFPPYDEVSLWLSTLDRQREEVRDKRIEAMSRKALRNSNWANILSAIAIITAIVAIIIACLIKN